MRTQKITRTRAWCDYCKKGMWSVKHMEVHERHCTMNPNRVCRVCKSLLEQEPTPLPELIAICKAAVPNLVDLKFDNSLHLNLMTASKECPACEMAAIRQSGIPVPAVHGFDFTSHMKAIWDDINNSKAEACNEGY